MTKAPNMPASTEYQLRPMTHADVAEVSALEASAQFSPWSEKLFTDLIEQARYQCCVLYHDKQLLGFVITEYVAGEATLHNIAVNPDVRGQGFGRRLMTQSVAYARDCGAEKLFLEVRASNNVAQQLYLNFGFEQVGERRNYYPTADGRESASIMMLSLV